MFRFFLSLLFTGITFAQTDYSAIRLKLNELINEEFFQSSGISVSIYDLTERQVIFEKDVNKLLRPGINMKILTSTAGLLFLGEGYNFRTSLWYTGKIINNTLYGDLYLQGGCDPDFVTSDLDSLIAPLKVLGVKEITGRLYLDLSFKDSLFWGKGWMWDDDPSTDAPYLSALNINDNAVKIFLTPGEEGSPAVIRTDPVTSYIKVLNQSMTVTDSLNSSEVSREWINRTNRFLIKGNLPLSDTGTAVILNIWNPENYFAVLFIESLHKNNIIMNDSICGAEVPGQAVKISEYNRPFLSVFQNLNKVSDNLSAEMMLLALAEKYYGKPATAKNGFRLIDSLVSLAGNNPGDFVFADGSGVSHYNLLSTELLNNVMKYVYFQESEEFPLLYNSFPAAGIDGTLAARMKGTSSENNVHAKTGTLSGVSSLSGYLSTPAGHKISFSVMIQNFKGSSLRARNYQDRICNILTSR